MSDSRQRNLERVFGEDVEADASWLRQRLRAGFDPERVALAAHLGDSASRVALEREAPAHTDLLGWVRDLEPWGGLGVQAGVRAAIAAGRRLLPCWDQLRPNDPRPHERLAAAEAWARCPCFEHACAARGRLTHRIDSDELDQVVTALRLVPAAAEVAQSPSESAGRRALFYAACSCSLAGTLTGEPETRAAIQLELLPWALELADPLTPPG